MNNKIPPPVVALVAVAAMWSISGSFPAARINFAGQTYAGWGLVGLGLLIDLVALGLFRRAKTTVNPISPEKAESLVVSGIYRLTRNPMYLGLLITLAGISLLFGNLLNAFVLVAFVAFITTFQIKPEERALTKLFGEDYNAYCNRVRRWI